MGQKSSKSIDDHIQDAAIAASYDDDPNIKRDTHYRLDNLHNDILWIPNIFMINSSDALLAKIVWDRTNLKDLYSHVAKATDSIKETISYVKSYINEDTLPDRKKILLKEIIRSWKISYNEILELISAYNNLHFN